MHKLLYQDPVEFTALYTLNEPLHYLVSSAHRCILGIPFAFPALERIQELRQIFIAALLSGHERVEYLSPAYTSSKSST